MPMPTNIGVIDFMQGIPGRDQKGPIADTLEQMDMHGIERSWRDKTIELQERCGRHSCAKTRSR